MPPHSHLLRPEPEPESPQRPSTKMTKTMKTALFCISLILGGYLGANYFLPASKQLCSSVKEWWNSPPDLIAAYGFNKYTMCEECREVDSSNPCKKCGSDNVDVDKFRPLSRGWGSFMWQRSNGALFVNYKLLHNVPQEFTISGEGTVYSKDKVTQTGHPFKGSAR